MKKIISSCLTIAIIFGLSQSAFATTDETNINTYSVTGTTVATINTTSTNSIIMGDPFSNPGPGKTYTVQCTRFVSGTRFNVGLGYKGNLGQHVSAGSYQFSGSFGQGSSGKFTSSSSHTGSVYAYISNYTNSPTINAGFSILK